MGCGAGGHCSGDGVSSESRTGRRRGNDEDPSAAAAFALVHVVGEARRVGDGVVGAREAVELLLRERRRDGRVGSGVCIVVCIASVAASQVMSV